MGRLFFLILFVNAFSLVLAQDLEITNSSGEPLTIEFKSEKVLLQNSKMKVFPSFPYSDHFTVTGKMNTRTYTIFSVGKSPVKLQLLPYEEFVFTGNEEKVNRFMNGYIKKDFQNGSRYYLWLSKYPPETAAAKFSAYIATLKSEAYKTDLSIFKNHPSIENYLFNHPFVLLLAHRKSHGKQIDEVMRLMYTKYFPKQLQTIDCKNEGRFFLINYLSKREEAIKLGLPKYPLISKEHSPAHLQFMAPHCQKEYFTGLKDYYKMTGQPVETVEEILNRDFKNLK